MKKVRKLKKLKLQTKNSGPARLRRRFYKAEKRKVGGEKKKGEIINILNL